MAVTLERTEKAGAPVPETAEAAALAVRELVEGFHVKEARELAEPASARFPESRELRYWDYVLSPGGVGVHPKSKRSTDKDREWIAANGEQYPEKWLALLEGELLGVDVSSNALRERIASSHASADDVFYWYQPRLARY